MKSHETKRREAWPLIAWMGAVVAGLLILYCLSEGAPTAGGGGLGPLLGAGIGASLAYLFTRHQRHEEEAQRRQALATKLLSEIRFLEGSIRTLRQGERLAWHEIAPYETAVYNAAGADLLLFDAETVHDLNTFYLLVYDLQAKLQDISRRGIERDSRTATNVLGRTEIYLLEEVTYISGRVHDVAARLRRAGGMWPAPLPLLPGYGLPLPDLPPPCFEDNK